MSMKRDEFCCGTFNPSLFFLNKVNTGVPVDPHEHDFPQLVYTVSGKGHYQIGDTVYPIRTGDLLIVPTGVTHSYVEEEEDNASVFCLGFSDFHLCGMPQNELVFPEGSLVLHSSGDFRHQLMNLFFMMFSEGTSNHLGRYYMQKSYLAQILILISREISNIDAEKGSGYHFETNTKTYAVSQIISYLNEHYAEKISLDQIAQNMYLSSVYISKIFKEETGESPINYLISIRLDKAKEQLSQEYRCSIKSIAASVGYDDVYHFSKLFKKYYGLSPLHFKKTVKQQQQQAKS